MGRRNTILVVTTYVVSLVVALTLLVTWVVYAVRSATRITELADRVGVAQSNVHWIVLAVGCGLLFLLIGGLSYQLALTLAERRHPTQQERFLSNITHELKSPLAAIKLHAQTLDGAELDAGTRRRSLGFIVEQTERMGRLVDNVLESSRLQARKRRLELEAVELEPFLDNYFRQMAPQLARDGVEIVPRLDTRAVVMATEDALERVLTNLVENAVRFSAPGGEVRCRVADVGENVILEVEDDGVGIPKKELNKVFDRFYQAGPEGDRRRQGTGLGLSIVAELVRRELGGSIRAHSNESRPGTCFVVELPRLEPEARS